MNNILITLFITLFILFLIFIIILYLIVKNWKDFNEVLEEINKTDIDI